MRQSVYDYACGFPEPPPTDEQAARVHIVRGCICCGEYSVRRRRGRALLFDVAMQYNGRNNGRLVAAAKALRPLCWRSDDGIQKAKTELLGLGLLVETRKGAKSNRAAWYALSWRPYYRIDNP